jgi:hypothetical protein
MNDVPRMADSECSRSLVLLSQNFLPLGAAMIRSLQVLASTK